MKQLKEKWNRFAQCAGFNAQDTEATFALLDSLYSEPYRRYHNWVHISTLLTLAEQWKQAIQDQIAFEAAIWFHDAIYVPSRADNEQNSAFLAQCILSKSKLENKTIKKIVEIILSTEYTKPFESDDADTALFHDLDFAIFAFPIEHVLTYDRNIHGEFLSTHLFPENEFNIHRSHFLQKMLNKNELYKVNETRAAWEEKARKNIEYLLTMKYQVMVEN